MSDDVFRWSCPQCQYSVTPNEIFSERKHFYAHALECVRCLYRTETKSTWIEAKAAYCSVLAPAQPSPRCGVCGSGDTMTICEGCWTRQPTQGEPDSVLREALTLGRDAVMESFDYVKGNDDQLMADARLRTIDAAIAVRASPAQSSWQPPEGFVLVPQAAIKWLHGEGPDDNGKWFGDAVPEIKPGKPIAHYWWRSVFRRMCSVSSTQQLCPRCKKEPLDRALLGAEGHICGNCWAEDRHASEVTSTEGK